MKLSSETIKKLDAWIKVDTWHTNHKLDMDRWYDFINQYQKDHGCSIDEAALREIIEKKDQVKFERIHLIQFGDFALIFECVYYEETEDYNKHKEIHQEILFEIKEAFEKNNIVIKHR